MSWLSKIGSALKSAWLWVVAGMAAALAVVVALARRLKRQRDEARAQRDIARDSGERTTSYIEQTSKADTENDAKRDGIIKRADTIRAEAEKEKAALAADAEARRAELNTGGNVNVADEANRRRKARQTNGGG